MRSQIRCRPPPLAYFTSISYSEQTVRLSSVFWECLDFFQPKQFPYLVLGLDIFHENELRASAVSVSVATTTVVACTCHAVRVSETSSSYSSWTSHFTNLINNYIPAAPRVIKKYACLCSLSSMGYMAWTPHLPQVPLHPILNRGTAIQIPQRPVSQFTGIPVISRTTKT